MAAVAFRMMRAYTAIYSGGIKLRPLCRNDNHSYENFMNSPGTSITFNILLKLTKIKVLKRIEKLGQPAYFQKRFIAVLRRKMGVFTIGIHLTIHQGIFSSFSASMKT